MYPRTLRGTLNLTISHLKINVSVFAIKTKKRTKFSSDQTFKVLKSLTDAYQNIKKSGVMQIVFM